VADEEEEEEEGVFMLSGAGLRPPKANLIERDTRSQDFLVLGLRYPPIFSNTEFGGAKDSSKGNTLKSDSIS
jgi:hypothetical protein